MKRRCLIIAGGELNPEFASCYIKEKYGSMGPELIIAADRGLEGAKILGLQPNIMLGDYDSVALELLEEYEKNDQVVSVQYPTEKDYTDTHLAVITAIERGAAEICILGATGSRLDHVMANMGLLLLGLKAGIETELVDSNNRIRMVQKHMTIEQKNQFGSYVSLLPFTEQVKGITLKGFKYPLNDADFSMGMSWGISNEITESMAEIKIRDGILYVIESKD